MDPNQKPTYNSHPYRSSLADALVPVPKKEAIRSIPVQTNDSSYPVRVTRDQPHSNTNKPSQPYRNSLEDALGPSGGTERDANFGRDDGHQNSVIKSGTTALFNAPVAASIHSAYNPPPYRSSLADALVPVPPRTQEIRSKPAQAHSSIFPPPARTQPPDNTKQPSQPYRNSLLDALGSSVNKS